MFPPDCIADLVYAYQPIVDPNTGITFAVEALLRGVEHTQYSGIDDFFDSTAEDGSLFRIDAALRRKAMAGFMLIPSYRRMKLFYNYDYRMHEMPDFRAEDMSSALTEYGIRPHALCLEISEKHRISRFAELSGFLANAEKNGLSIALDDFGSGFAGMELFYHADPRFLKFDRFLIQNIDSDVKKRSFCSHIVNLAKLLGVLCIAEGIETRREFDVCRELGFNLVQGYFIAMPSAPDAVTRTNDVVRGIVEQDRRRRTSRDAEILLERVEYLDPVHAEDTIESVMKRFREDEGSLFFPVLDDRAFPLGIVHENSFKRFVYSPYGRDLLRNRSIASSLDAFIEKYPIVDINTPQEKILEIFVNHGEREGVIVINDLCYAGFLTAKSLLAVLNERNLTAARELNPLTKLPGNMLIHAYLREAYGDDESDHAIIYFDFNDFKPFNDAYGFRQGDRAITFFADILRKEFEGSFIGHVGGDDFFVGVGGISGAETCVRRAAHAFASGMLSFHSPEETAQGFYTAKERSGSVARFPLITVTAAMLAMPAGKRAVTYERLTQLLSGMKQEAKSTRQDVLVRSIGSREPASRHLTYAAVRVNSCRSHEEMI